MELEAKEWNVEGRNNILPTDNVPHANKKRKEYSEDVAQSVNSNLFLANEAEEIGRNILQEYADDTQ